MTHTTHISPLFCVPLAAALLSCTRTDAERPLSGTFSSPLAVAVEVGAPATKGIVDGSSLAFSGGSYSLFVCGAGTHEPYDAEGLYGNVQAWYGSHSSSTGWWYSYAGSRDARFSPFSVVTDDMSRLFDVYAASPFREGLTIDGGYDFNLATAAEDVMYATYGEPATNLSLTVSDGATVPVTVTFHHALSRLVLHFRLQETAAAGQDGTSAMTLRRVELRHTEGAATPLYTEGRMNLVTGAVTPLQLSSSSEQTASFSSAVASTSSWTAVSVLVCPQEYLSDGDFTLRFFFEGSGDTQALAQDYALKVSDLLHGDGTHGFRPGYSYHLYFVLGNYVHLSGAEVSGEWTSAGEQEITM